MIFDWNIRNIQKWPKMGVFLETIFRPFLDISDILIKNPVLQKMMGQKIIILVGGLICGLFAL